MRTKRGQGGQTSFNISSLRVLHNECLLWRSRSLLKSLWMNERGEGASSFLKALCRGPIPFWLLSLSFMRQRAKAFFCAYLSAKSSRAFLIVRPNYELGKWCNSFVSLARKWDEETFQRRFHFCRSSLALSYPFKMFAFPISQREGAFGPLSFTTELRLR